MKLIKVVEEALIFSDGTTLRAHHTQDCCETVYADFQQLVDTDFANQEFDRLVVSGVPGKGFRINGYFVPCYDEQNGGYSSELVLMLTDRNGHETIQDISDWVEERHD